MNIIYRKANINDIELLADTRVSLIDEDSGLNENEKKDLYESNIEYMQQAIKKDNFISFVAFDNNILVGTASACLYRTLPGKKLPKGRNAYIQNVYVLPSYRRHGIGKNIIKMIINEAKQRGYTRITLHATKIGEIFFSDCGFKSAENLGLNEMSYIN